MSKAERDSNIELLRILATLGVFFLHFNGAVEGGTYRNTTGANNVIVYVLETLAICGVDLLVLISGYFMINSEKCNLWKPIELIFQSCILGSVIPYIIELVLTQSKFEISTLVWKMLDIGYFVILYSVMFVLSPYINRLLKSLDRKKLRTLIVVLFLLFSVYPIIIDCIRDISGKNYNAISSVGLYGDGDGYTIVNFIMMYCIGAFIRLNGIEKDKRIKYPAIILMLLLAVDFAWAFKGTAEPTFSAWEYCNPIIVLIAVFAFISFKRIEIGKNRVINTLAKSSFTFFILHARFLHMLDVDAIIYQKPIAMFALILLADVAIYIVIWIIWWMWNKATGRMFETLEKKFANFRICVE